MTDQPEAKLSAADLFALELRKLEAENAWRQRDHELQSRDLDLKFEEAKRGRIWNPLLIAIASAFVAGVFSIAVQYVTAENQSKAEQSRQTNQLAADRFRQPLNMETEAFRAEATRIAEAVKPGDVDKSACNLSLLVAAGLVVTPTVRGPIQDYLRNRDGQAPTQSFSGPPPTSPVPAAPVGRTERGQGLVGCGLPSGAPATATPPPVSPQVASPAPEIINYETDWRGGGYSQPQACADGIVQNQPKFSNRRLTPIGSREEFRWTIFREGQYKYFCTLRVD